MSEKKWYVEEYEISAFASWVVIILFSAAIAGFGLMVYCLIPDAPRRWNYGQLPDTPAESIYSTEEPAAGRRPARQLPRLPESYPVQPATPNGSRP